MTFKKGESGNPAGRKEGSRSKVTVLLEAMIAGEAESIVRTLIDAAKGGDVAAAKVLIDRLIPKRKERSIVVDGYQPDGSATEQAQAIATAAAAGEITPTEAGALLQILLTRQRIASLDGDPLGLNSLSLGAFTDDIEE